MEAEERRLAAERKRIQEQQAWEAAMAKAKEDFAEHFRREWFRGQIAAHQEAEDLRPFVAAARPKATGEAAEWLDWAASFVEELDPLGREMAPPIVPDPEPEDLKPFLGGWSPYRPHSISTWS